MMIRITTIALVVLLVLPVGLSADDKKLEADSATMAMMAEWAKYATPGAEHKNLAKQVGKWTYTSTMWMDPSQPPVESKGTAETIALLGGRFFRTEHKGDFQGMPFEGIATSGYNLYTKVYENSWIDNMGTVMITSTGTGNADGSVVTATGSYDCSMTKKVKKFRSVTKWNGPDSYTMSWYETIEGDPERKTMEIASVRVK